MEQYPRQYLYLRTVRAKLFIDANFASDIDLDKIADEACFSKFHFVRLFKSIYGRTPHQYLTDVRIEQAKEYLADGQTVAVPLTVRVHGVAVPAAGNPAGNMLTSFHIVPPTQHTPSR